MKLVFRVFDRTVQILMFLCIAGFVAAAFAQVVCRFGLNDSLTWSEEFCRYLFVWMVFLGAGIGILHRRHVTIDIVPNLIPEKGKKIYGFAIDLLIAVFSVMLMYYGYRFAEKGMRQNSPAMQIPLGYVYSGVVLGGAVMLINTLRVMAADLFAVPVAAAPEPEPEPEMTQDEFNRLLGIEAKAGDGKENGDA